MSGHLADEMTWRQRDRGARGVSRFLGVVVAAVLALACLPFVATAIGDAVSRGLVDQVAPATSFETCAALRREYPLGVGTVAAVDGLTRDRLPAVDNRAYEANADLDIDADGIACERRR
jgi:hypothetical protein